MTEWEGIGESVRGEYRGRQYVVSFLGVTKGPQGSLDYEMISNEVLGEWGQCPLAKGSLMTCHAPCPLSLIWMTLFASLYN